MRQYSSVLITGGTGSLGAYLVSYFLRHASPPKRLVVFSRRADKQKALQEAYPATDFPALEFRTGDIRDYAQLAEAMQGIEALVHTAAIKLIPWAEQNVWETVQHNIIGTENVVRAAQAAGVKSAVMISTDKAVAPLSVYGASKMIADKLWLSHAKSSDACFSLLRIGNLLGAQGSVFSFFLEKRKEGYLPITDLGMSRFLITPSQAAQAIAYALSHALGGEIFVPKMPAYTLQTLAEALAPDCTIQIVGKRQGEQLYDEPLHPTEIPQALELSESYCLVPLWAEKKKYEEMHHGKAIAPDLAYRSDHASYQLNKAQLKTLLGKYMVID